MRQNEDGGTRARPGESTRSGAGHMADCIAEPRSVGNQETQYQVANCIVSSTNPMAESPASARPSVRFLTKRAMTTKSGKSGRTKRGMDINGWTPPGLNSGTMRGGKTKAL